MLFSASNKGSSLARLVTVVTECHVAVTSELARRETARNIRLKRPGWTRDFEALLSKVEVVETAGFPLPVELAEKDRPILCAAIRSGCDALATGDRKHFGHLYDTRVEGVLVVTPTRLSDFVP